MADAISLHREMFDAIQRRDIDRIRDLYHPDYEYRGTDGTVGGFEAGLAVAEAYTTAFPDLTFEVRRELACGDHVSVIELTARGTHQGELEGIAPTGRTVEVDGCNVIEERDGKIYREQDYFDSLTIMRQLGVLD